MAEEAEVGRKDNPCSCSHAMKKMFWHKCLLWYFCKKTQRQHFERELQTHLEELLQMKGYRRFLKNTFKSFFNCKC